jgi:SWR1-complex protein 3
VNGADLVFEYNENPNVRYNLPKDCIVEKVSNNEFLISFLVVHNQEEINKFLERKRVRLEKLANKEKSKQEKEGVLPLKTSAEEQAKGESIRRSTRSKHDDTEKVKTEVIEPKVPAKEEPKEPIPYFTAVSFKLSNVSERYDPIFLNSFNKYDEVKAKMEKILKEGIRVPKYYIWYTVDAYRDEALAENLRNELYLVENPPKGKYKKRGRPSVNTDEKQEVAKRVKV